MLTEKLFFNSDYKIRSDSDRFIIYSSSQEVNESSSQWLSFIHPLHVVIFQVFENGKILQEALNEISQVIGSSDKIAYNLIQNFINNKESVKVEWKGNTIALPKNILINKDLGERTSIKKTDITGINFNDVDFTTRRLKIAPIDFSFMINNRCSVKCKYCYADLRTGISELSIDVFEKILKESRNIGIREISLIGGDFLILKNWPNFIGLMINYGFSPPYLSTKHPVSKKTIKLLDDIGYNNELQISLDSINETILQKSIAANQSYMSKVKNGIFLLDKADKKIRINTVITNYNCWEKELSNLCDFLNTINNIVGWEIRYVMPSLYPKTNFKKLRPSRKRLEDIGNYIKSTIVTNCNHPVVFNEDIQASDVIENTSMLCNNINRRNMCTANLNHFFILPDGKVTICEQLYWHPQFIIGDINKNTIKEIWNSDKALKLAHLKRDDIQEKSACKTCSGFEKCFHENRRCWIEVLKNKGFYNWSFPDPTCQKNNKVI